MIKMVKTPNVLQFKANITIHAQIYNNINSAVGSRVFNFDRCTIFSFEVYIFNDIVCLLTVIAVIIKLKNCGGYKYTTVEVPLVKY